MVLRIQTKYTSMVLVSYATSKKDYVRATKSVLLLVLIRAKQDFNKQDFKSILLYPSYPARFLTSKYYKAHASASFLFMEKKRSACILLFKILNLKPSFVSLREIIRNKQTSPLPARRIELMVVGKAQQIFLLRSTFFIGVVLQIQTNKGHVSYAQLGCAYCC